MKRKRVFNGWMGRMDIDRPAAWGDLDDELLLTEVFRLKSGRDEWMKEDWPPVKVRVTVEILE